MARSLSPLFEVFLRGCVLAEGRSLCFWLFPGYQKHPAQVYKVVGLSQEQDLDPGLCEHWKAFLSGSCTLSSFICSDREEGVSVRHGNFFLPVSSINLNAKTQTFWNALKSCGEHQPLTP